MNDLTPLEPLFEAEGRSALPLPPDLATLYGHFHLPVHPAGRPYIIGNFVTTLDGVVTLNEPGHTGGGDISGWSKQDQLVMGLLRAVADSVIVGAGTLRAAPRHRWTAQYIYPPQADAYQKLRTSLGKTTPPLNVIVTARGKVDLGLPVFQSGEVPVLLVTTVYGESHIRTKPLPSAVQVVGMNHADSVSAQEIVQAVCEARQCQIILVEGGPQLLGNFLAEQLLDELFLTLAPQIAGRDEETLRPGLVSGQRFAPLHPLWGTLVSVKRGGSHLFLRYTFKTKEH